MNKEIRWRQRFTNLENAFLFLKGGLEKQSLDPYQEAGIIQMIKDGHLWLEMLEKRNILSHTYNRQQASDSVKLIKSRYFPGLKQVYLELKKRCSD